MYEEITIENHLGEKVIVGQNNKIFVNENDLRDYAWDSLTQGDKISGFTRGIVSKTLPLRIVGSDFSDKNAIMNRIYEVCEKDIIATKYSKIYVGDYYFKCYISESKKKDYLKKALKYSADEIKVTTDYGFWIKESLNRFDRSGESSSDTDAPIVTTKRNLDFNFDFNIDFLSVDGIRKLYNYSFADSNFKMTIYGAKSNPTVQIGGNTYKVFTELLASEKLEIDSISKTVVKYKYDGTIENVFNLRDKSNYIFQRIPSGSNSVIWDGDFAFDIILYDERSEPLWT